MRFRLTIRDLLWLAVVVAVAAVGLFSRWIWPTAPPATAPEVIVVDRGQDGKISWNDAKRLIASGETKMVMQTHARLVVLQLKNGTSYQTVENQIDEALQYIRQCGLRGKIDYATE
jgi:hypothetical protein